MPKTIGVKAVYDSDLESFLKSLGILDELVAEKLNCTVCGCLVDLDNFGSIFAHNDKIGVSCNSNKCIRLVTAGEAKSTNG